MGQMADDIINGITCELCSRYFIDKNGNIFEHTYPVVCKECYKYLTKEERKYHQKALVNTFS
jgi:hypothetical protein